MKTKAKKKANYSGGRYKIECPNCGERDVTKMVTGQRSAYAECHCGCCFDVETGLGIQRRINVGRDRRTVMNDLVKQLLPEVKRDLKRVIDYDNRYLVRAAKGIERHTKALKTNQAMLASADTPEMEQKLDAILEEVKKLGVTGLKMDSYYCGMSGRKKLNGRLQDATVRFSFSTLGIAASVTVNYMHLAYIRYFSKLTVNNRELDLILETK